MTEAARRLGISWMTLYRLVREGAIPTFSNPLDKRQRLVPLSAVEQLRDPAAGPRPQPCSLGAIDDPDLPSDQTEEYMRAHWKPE